MDKREAEALYDSGKDPSVKRLLELDHENRIFKDELASQQQNSTNSSKPPSSDGPELVRKKTAPKEKKHGGQTGHTGKCRELLPAEEMDRVHDIWAARCEKCFLPLKSGEARETSPPLRHQVFEVPELRPIKTEYRCHETGCACGHRTRAPLPPQAAQSCFGPRAYAIIAYLVSSHLGTRRGVCEIMNTLFGIDISLGSVCNVLDRVAGELEPVVDEIRQTLANLQNLNVDETGWKSKGERRTLWVFLSSVAVYFCIAASRGSCVLSFVQGEAFTGILTSDDHSAYSAYHKNGLRQLCWAHLIRKFKALEDVRGSPDACRFAKCMLKEIEKLFTRWYAFLDKALTREELRQSTALIRGRMKRLCRNYESSRDNAVVTRASKTLKNWNHLFTFIFHLPLSKLLHIGIKNVIENYGLAQMMDETAADDRLGGDDALNYYRSAVYELEC